MSKILYHKTSHSGDVSVFDEAIYKVSKGCHIKMASPYIGISYITRIANLSLTWKLLTDVNAWIESLSKKEREKAVHLLEQNSDKIRNCELLHAKIVIGEQYAYFGSANLTESGVLKRAEIGMLVDAPQDIVELNDWFDNLWETTSSVEMDEVIELVRWLDERESSEAYAASPKVSSSNEKYRKSFFSEQEASNPSSRVVISGGNSIWRNPNVTESNPSPPAVAKKPDSSKSKKVLDEAKKISTDDYLLLDLLCAEVLKMAVGHGNNIPMHSPWSVLQAISSKTKISWNQVSKALTKASANSVNLIDVSQKHESCSLNLSSLTSEKLSHMPKTAALIDNLDK